MSFKGLVPPAHEITERWHPLELVEAEIGGPVSTLVIKHVELLLWVHFASYYILAVSAVSPVGMTQPLLQRCRQQTAYLLRGSHLEHLNYKQRNFFHVNCGLASSFFSQK